MFSLFVILLWFSGYDSKGFLLALTDFLGFSIIHQTPVLDTYYSQQPLTTKLMLLVIPLSANVSTKRFTPF